MRTTYICLLLLLPFFAFAQGDFTRAQKLPFIPLELDRVPEPLVSDDGKHLFFPPGRIVSPGDRQRIDREFMLPTDAFTHQQPKRIYSPNLQRTVYTYEALVTTESKKQKRYDWISLGFGPEFRSGSVFRFDEKDYVLAITNDGKLIVTDAGDVKYSSSGKWGGAYNVKIGKMKGLAMLDPVTGSRREITSDILVGKGFYNGVVTVSGDSKKVLVTRSKEGPGEDEAFVYDLETGNKISFLWPIYHFQRGMGSRMALVEQWGVFGDASKKAAKVIRLSDGATLIDQPISDQYGMNQFYLAPNDELHHYDPETMMVATFTESGGEFRMSARVKLDTAGLALAPTKYYFKVMDKYIALVPSSIPATYYKPYPLFGYFFDRATGTPAVKLWPLFKQPEVPPTPAEITAKKRSKCEYLNTVVPFKVGALLANKNGHFRCQRPGYIFAGIDCEQGTYLLQSLGGGIIPLSDNFISEYEVCQPGSFRACYSCKGQGSITESFTVADDGWKQVNFNVYVRNKNATKVESVTNPCKSCNGKGYLPQ